MVWVNQTILFGSIVHKLNCVGQSGAEMYFTNVGMSFACVEMA